MAHGNKTFARWAVEDARDGGASDTDAVRYALKLGVRFRDVWFYRYGRPTRDWYAEPQVDDPDTFDECVETARLRLNATHALYEYEGRWVLVGGKCGYAKDYPNREAAEMVAIHEEAKA